MKIDAHIQEKLRHLRLTGILQTLQIRIEQAEKGQSGYMEFLMTPVAWFVWTAGSSF